MAILAAVLAQIASVLNKREAVEFYIHEAKDLRSKISQRMWNPITKFFHCLDREDHQIPIKTITGFYALQAKACSTEQLHGLVEHLKNPLTFNRPNRVPTVAADESMYSPQGNYFHGGVWAFTNHSIIRGLEDNGHGELAREIALTHWAMCVQLYQRTGTFWEYLSPEYPEPGHTKNSKDQGKNARSDFAGFGVLPIITYLLEYAIGLRANGPEKILTWDLHGTGRSGCQRFSFGGITTDLECQKRLTETDIPVIRAKTNHPYRLIVKFGGKSSTAWVKDETVNLFSTAAI